jgi:hypothetical protein
MSYLDAVGQKIELLPNDAPTEVKWYDNYVDIPKVAVAKPYTTSSKPMSPVQQMFSSKPMSSVQQMFVDEYGPLIYDLYYEFRNQYCAFGLFKKVDYNAFLDIFLDNITITDNLTSYAEAENDVMDCE